MIGTDSWNGLSTPSVDGTPVGEPAGGAPTDGTAVDGPAPDGVLARDPGGWPATEGAAVHKPAARPPTDGTAVDGPAPDGVLARDPGGWPATEGAAVHKPAARPPTDGTAVDGPPTDGVLARDPADGAPVPGARSGETPGLRLFGLLEVVAASYRPFTLQSMVEATGMPKPTVHRMLQQLEGAGLLQRQGDGRHYTTGVRLRHLAEHVLANDTHHGARHAVLRSLVDEIGESCNITALSGDEVIYLDRVETPEPLRFHLRPGSRVPCHATASGKILLAHMGTSQRRQLLSHAPLRRCTANTITDLDRLEEELAQVRRDGFAMDDEEFLPGLICVAVPVPGPGRAGRPALCIAAQAPVVRLSPDRAPGLLPALRRAAQAVGDIEGGSSIESGSNGAGAAQAGNRAAP